MVQITGAGGFVGKNLSVYLQNHHIAIKGLTRAELVDLNFNVFNNTDCVIHLAGKAHDLKNVIDPDSYYEANFELTKKLYDAFLQSNATKFVFISSVKAAADTVEGMLLEETHPNPQTHYGKSKLMAEHYIRAQTLPAEKSFFILRPCMIHGPGNKGNLNLLYQFVKKGIPFPFASYDNRRSYLSVDNLCFIIKELITGNIPSGIYHVADDEPLSTAKVFSLLAQATHKKARLWYIPRKLISMLALVGDRINLPLNTERLSKLTDNYIVSNKKIKQAMNKVLPLTSTEGLIKTAQSFNKNLHS